MKRTAFLCVLALPVVTGATEGEYMIYGAGTTSCGEWLHQREESSWYHLGQWVLGYLTALDTFKMRLKETDPAAVSAYVDNYCRQHPLEQLHDAALDLSLELIKRNKAP